MEVKDGRGIRSGGGKARLSEQLAGSAHFFQRGLLMLNMEGGNISEVKDDWGNGMVVRELGYLNRFSSLKFLKTLKVLY